MEHWEIAPHRGLGPLTFGMTEAAAVDAARVYGPVTHQDPMDGAPNEADEIYKALVEAEGEEVARQVMAEMLADGVDLRTRRRVIVGEGLLLDFVDDGLEDIMCTLRTPDVHIGGHRVFGVDCLPAMRRLQELNGAPSLVKDRDCLFVNLHLTAFECLHEVAPGMVRSAREGTDEASQKTISWRASERDPNEDLSEHRALDLLA